MLVEQIDRVRFLLAENSHQPVGAADFFLPRGLHMDNSALQHPLKTQGRLCITGVIRRQQWSVYINERNEFMRQFFKICAADTL